MRTLFFINIFVVIVEVVLYIALGILLHRSGDKNGGGDTAATGAGLKPGSTSL